MAANLTLRLAAAADLAAIMAIERGPGFERFVGRSSIEEHQGLMASANHVYFVGTSISGAIVAISRMPTATSISSGSPSFGPTRAWAARFCGSSSAGCSPARDRIGFGSTVSPTMRGPSGSTKSSVSRATACCGRPISRRTEIASISR